MKDRITTGVRQRVQAARRNSLIQSSLALMSGSIFAQAVFLLTSPVLTRVFGFADFGGLANYNAWVTFLALLGVLRYEHAIIVARDEESRGRAVVLAAALTVASSSVYAVVAVALFVSSPGQGYLRDILGLILLIPVGVFFANLGSILNQLSMRAGLFRELAIMAGLQAVLGVAIQVGLGLLEVENAIVIGALVGSIAYAAAMSGVLRRKRTLAGLRVTLDLASLRRTAVEFANFPRYALGADALALLTLSFTPVLVSALFNPAVAGILAFAVRVVRLPMLVISTAIAGVLRKEGIDHLQRSGDLTALYRSIVKTLLAVGVAPCTVVLLFGPQIFAVVFGEQWAEAGRVVQVLSPGILLEFVAFPLSTFYLITDSQRTTLKLQLASTVLLFGSIAFGSTVLGDFMQTCVLISATMVLVNLASLALAWRVAKIRRGEPAGARAESNSR